MLSRQEKQQKQSCDDAIVALQSGNKDALSVIYDVMAKSILGLAYAITGNYEDAEDVLQNTMIGIVRSAGGYRKNSNAKAWILAIARNQAMDILRKRRDIVSLDAPEASEVPYYDSRLPLAEVDSLLNMLGDTEKQIVLLRLQEKLSYKEIAKLTGLSVFAAQKKYQRAIAALKKETRD